MSYDRNREIDGEERCVSLAFRMRRRIAKLARDERAMGRPYNADIPEGFREGQLDALLLLVNEIRRARKKESP